MTNESAIINSDEEEHDVAFCLCPWLEISDQSRVEMAENWVEKQVLNEIRTDSRTRRGIKQSQLIDMSTRNTCAPCFCPSPIFEDPSTTLVRVWSCPTLTATMILAKDACQLPSGRVGVLNMASGFIRGSHFKLGGTAQEEYLCITTTLFASLKAEFYQKSWGDRCLVYSPAVRILRPGPGFLGLMMEHEQFYIDVISSQAVKKPQLSPPDDPDGTYASIIEHDRARQKFEDVLNIAVERGITHLVLGPLGCGFYCNPPTVTAKLMRSVLESKDWRARGIRSIVVSMHDFSTSVFKTFCDVFDGMERTVVDRDGADIAQRRAHAASMTGPPTG